LIPIFILPLNLRDTFGKPHPVRSFIISILSNEQVSTQSLERSFGQVDPVSWCPGFHRLASDDLASNAVAQSELYQILICFID
jgi:hypothetical protein